MATKSFAYDHPTYVARHAAVVNLPAIAASTPAGKFMAFTNLKVKSISAGVNIAGTNGAAGYDIYNGTTSVGAIIAGTSTAGSVLTGLTQDITLSSGSFLDIRTKANSATLAASLTVEYEVVPGATVTA